MVLRERLEKRSYATFLREMIGFAGIHSASTAERSGF
jgi:hypothetical protein